MRTFILRKRFEEVTTSRVITAWFVLTALLAVWGYNYQGSGSYFPDSCKQNGENFPTQVITAGLWNQCSTVIAITFVIIALVTYIYTTAIKLDAIYMRLQKCLRLVVLETRVVSLGSERTHSYATRHARPVIVGLGFPAIQRRYRHVLRVSRFLFLADGLKNSL